MTDKKKRLLLLVGGVAVLVAILVGVLFSCQKPAETPVDTPQSSSPTDEKMTYTIELTTEGGMALEGVGVYIYTDETQEELVWFAKTDADGKITFTDAASDSYVAVLSGAPEGYQVEEFYLLTGELTQIVLAAGSEDGDLENITYKLGDAMLNFSVTTPDGTVHTLSEILKEKNAVILNFWYLQCQPCKSEFPYLQEAYEKYSEDIEVLAMNPINTDDEEIAAFQKEQGYTFPMAQCDPAWEKAMQLTAYPTTVVVDRFGTISLIHKGSIPDTETFENIFAFYGSEDYEKTMIMENLEDLQEQIDKQTVGSADTPLEIGGVTSFQVTVNPGQFVHVNLYKVTDMTLSLNNPNATVTYNGYTYQGNWISFTVTTPDTFTPAKLIFGNSGDEKHTYTVRLANKPGSVNNPHAMALGEMTASVDAGNEQGVYYTCAAPGTGLLKVEVLSATEGVNYDIILYNLNSYAQRSLRGNGVTDPDTGTTTFGVNVKPGQTIQMIVGTLPDSSNSYPAGSFKLKISFGEGESEGEVQIQEKITYAVSVTDENREPVAGVMLDLKIDDAVATITTDENGIASTKRVAGTYPVTLRVPKGYTADATEYLFTEKMTTFSIKLNTLVENWEEYTVTVVDEDGKPISGALVTIETTYIQTDESGQATFKLLKGSYTAMVSAPEGYAAEENGYPFAEGTTELTVSLKKGEGGTGTQKTDYKVTVLDQYGAVMDNVAKVTFLRDGVAAAIVSDVSSGTASAKLTPGKYTAAVEFASGLYYYDPAQAILTAENPTAQITALPKICVEDGVGAEMLTLHVGEGVYDSFYVETGKVYTDLEEGRCNYFLFAPTVQGQYRITVSNPGAVMSYWGGSTFFVNEQPDKVVDNTITLNVKPSNLGSGSERGVTHIIGISDADTVLQITWIGDAILDENDLVPEEYVPKTAPKAYTLRIPAGKSLTYVDLLNGKADDYKLFKGRDGYYHLGSAAGPIMYVNLGTEAPYLSLSDFLGVTDPYAANNLNHVFYEDGVAVRKETYTNTMIDFVNCRDANTGVYPLAEDLMYMLKMGGEHRGMWDIENPNYIFRDANGDPIEVNVDLAWMFACCYLQ